MGRGLVAQSSLAVVVAVALVGCGQTGDGPVPSPPLTVSGTVFDAEDDPCTGCPVTITSDDHPMPEIAQTTGLDGHYSWSLPGIGTYVVQAIVDDVPVSRTLEVTGPVDDVDLRPTGSRRSP